MHLYKWTPQQVYSMTLEDFAFAVKHTLRIGREQKKAHR